jgi:hypothetical protein
MIPVNCRMILDAGHWMLDKTINRSFLFIKYPASGIQHHFASSNVISSSTRRFEAKLH